MRAVVAMFLCAGAVVGVRMKQAGSLSHRSMVVDEPLNADELSIRDATEGSFKCAWNAGGVATSLIERDGAMYRDHMCERGESFYFQGLFKLQGDVLLCRSHENFKNKDSCETNNVLFMYPWRDPNGAFCVRGNVCFRFLEWQYDACSVQMRRAQSVAEATMALDEFPNDSIMHANLGGHGNGSMLQWGDPSGDDSDECGKSMLCIGNKASEEFLHMLSSKMQRHGSVFVESCLSATSDESLKKDGLNLAQYVANIVGKGLQVIGSDESFGRVRVKRFTAWHAKLDQGDLKDMQRLYPAVGATCPAWAESSEPNDEGDCTCPAEKTCKTNQGRDCPQSGGRSSDKHFLPLCAESWSKVQCQCA